MAQGSPTVVVVPYPMPPRVMCPRCWVGGDRDARRRGAYNDPLTLAKHQKACHPGDGITYECSVCGYRPEHRERYPLRVVKRHFEEHSSRARVEVAATAGRAAPLASSSRPRTTASTAPSASVTRAGTSGARKRSPRATPGPASDDGRRVTRSAATHGHAPSAAPTLRPPPPPARAQPLTPSPSAYVTLSSSSAEEDGDDVSPSYAAVTRAPATRTAATTPPPPAVRTAGANGAATGEGATKRTPAAGNNGSSGGPDKAVGKLSRVGALKEFFESPPEARPAVMSPVHTPTGTGDGRPRRWYSPLDEAPPAHARSPLPAAQPAVARVCSGEARAVSLAGAAFSPAATPRGTPPSTGGASPGPAITPPNSTPVSAAPAALTTCTVVTTVAGSPIMSTGLPSARGWGVSPPAMRTPPPRGAGSPPTVSSAVPRTTISQPGVRATPPSPPGRQLRPRGQRAPKHPRPSGSEGDTSSGGDGDAPWTVAPGRAVRRSARRVTRVPSGEEAAGTRSRAAPGPPPITLADFLPGRGGTSTTEARRRTPLEGIAEAAREGGTGECSAVRPSASVDVRGVMGRRRPTASVGGHAGATRATAAPANRAVAGARPPAPRREPASAAGSARGAPAAATGAEMRPARQRATERRRLVALADSAATHADLESLAAQVAEFFGGRVQDGGVPRNRGRPGRSREAGENARGERARDGDRAEGAAPADPPMFQGEGGGDRVREATRIQALFRRNRRRAVREVLAGPAEVCKVPARRVQEHFQRLYCGGQRLDGAAPVEPTDALGEGENTAALVGPFAEREVHRRLKRMNNSAPGPDGVTYRDLRVADPSAQLLAAVFNACLRLRAVPSSWKTSNTILVYKKGDRDMLENWRPLALGDTTPKLFAAVLADRLTDWAVDNRKLSPAQKGFLRDEGCYEHNFVLQEILTDVRRSRKEVVVSWLDLSNAFGSVPHEAIRRALVRAGVPESLIEIWGSMYDGCTTRVRTADGYTAPIHVRSGVRQGCPLSPVVFDLVIDSVLRAVSDVDTGYELLGSRWSVMAYADDLVLVSRTPADMRRLLAVAEIEASAVGLRFNPAKCATLHIGGGQVGRVRPTVFEIQGQPVRPMAEGEAYEHLGVPTGFSVDQTPHAAMLAMAEDLRAVDRSLLAPWQKSEAVATFLLPRLDFLLRGARIEKRPLKALDLQIRRSAKAWMGLPQRAGAELVYLPPAKGGCGLLPLADLADVLTIAHVFRLLTADDRAVKDLAWASLGAVVHRRLGHPPNREEVAAFLSGSLEGGFRGGGESSLWSSARNAARRQSDRFAVRWRWLTEREELVLECRGSRGRIVKIPPGARAQVIGRLRSAVAEYYEYTLVAKPDQGKVFEVSLRDRVSNHFVRSGNFTRFADWRFIHRARLNVLPLNGARRWGEGDRRCRRCGAEAETLPHVICHCGPHSAAVQWRHDAILHRLRRACRLPGEVTVNQRVEGLDGELGVLRPDLVVRHEPSKSVVICDVTVPFENRCVAFEEARARKIAKYSPMAEALQRRGYRVVVTAFVVGALGSWDPRNEAVLKLLRVGKAYASMMRRLMVSDTIRWSRDIYVEHVSGVRQYHAPPRPDSGFPEVSPPRAVRRRVTGARADGEIARGGSRE